MTQEALNSLYSGFLARASVPPALASRLSCPLLLFMGPTWPISEQRLLLIGQETLDWNFRSGEYYDWPHPPLASLAHCQSYDHAVPALVHGYAELTSRSRSPTTAAPSGAPSGFFESARRRAAPERSCGPISSGAPLMGAPLSTRRPPLSFRTSSPFNRVCWVARSPYLGRLAYCL